MPGKQDPHLAAKAEARTERRGDHGAGERKRRNAARRTPEPDDPYRSEHREIDDQRHRVAHVVMRRERDAKPADEQTSEQLGPQVGVTPREAGASAREG